MSSGNCVRDMSADQDDKNNIMMSRWLLQTLGLEKSPSMEFRELTKRDAQLQMSLELHKLWETCPGDLKDIVSKEFTNFEKIFSTFVNESGPSVEWNKIQKIPSASVINYSELGQPEMGEIRDMLNKIIVVKLNGGLGTSMGCQGPKSIIPVRSDLTFLDLTVQQIEYLNKTYGSDVPLVLMNSFNTEDDTVKVVRKYQEFQGKKYAFISNIDNLGATVDLGIINFLLSGPNAEKCGFLMEVTDKTRADVKGGTLINYEDKLRLLEIAQVPKEHVDDFKSVKTFKIFNTNNLWINLNNINDVLQEGKLDMEVIVNNKTLDNGLNIIQLEQAVGSAMKCFDGAIGLNVPRSRFLPVKKTDDLLLVMSNLYYLQCGFLTMSPKRMFPSTPLIKLGPNHFSKVKEFLKRFASIPDILELDHLTVSGDVTFGNKVSLKGTVIIIANHGDRIDIPPGAILENKIVSGNLRILDH